jgi:transcriptional regulator with XRE-family HTH domain
MAALGEQIRKGREAKGWTQNELAIRCSLDIRTIQRIENGRVSPRLYTLRIIENILGEDLCSKSSFQDESIEEYRRKFQQRKTLRVMIAFSAGFVLLITALIVVNSWVPKHIWGPIYFVVMCLHLIAIVIVWRCPGCNAILGEVFSTYYCTKCGLRLHD